MGSQQQQHLRGLMARQQPLMGSQGGSQHAMMAAYRQAPVSLGPALAGAGAGVGMGMATGAAAATQQRQGLSSQQGGCALDQLRQQTTKMVHDKEVAEGQLAHYSSRLEEANKELDKTKSALTAKSHECTLLARTLEEERTRFNGVEATVAVVTQAQHTLIKELSMAKNALTKVDTRRTMMETLLLEQNNHCMGFEERFDALCKAQDGLEQELREERLKAAELGGLLDGALGDLAAKEQELRHECGAKGAALKEAADTKALLNNMASEAGAQRERADDAEAARRADADAAGKREAALLQDIDKARQESDALRTALEEARAAILKAEAEAAAAAAKAEQELQETRSGAIRDLAAKDEEITKSVAEAEELRARLAEAAKAAEDACIKIQEAEKVLGERDSTVAQLSAGKESLDQEISQLRERFEAAEARTAAGQADLDVLGLQVSDLEARLKAAAEERGAAVAAAKSTAEAAAAKELQAYQQNNAKAYDAIQRRCNEAEAAKDELGSTLAAAHKEIKALQTKAAKAATACDEADAATEELRTKLAHAQKELAAARAAATKAAGDAADAAESRDEHHQQELAAAKNAAAQERDAALAALREELGAGATVLHARLDELRASSARAAEAALAKQQGLESAARDLEARIAELDEGDAEARAAAAEAQKVVEDKDAELCALSEECAELRAELEAAQEAATAARESADKAGREAEVAKHVLEEKAAQQAATAARAKTRAQIEAAAARAPAPPAPGKELQVQAVGPSKRSRGAGKTSAPQQLPERFAEDESEDDEKEPQQQSEQLQEEHHEAGSSDSDGDLPALAAAPAAAAGPAAKRARASDGYLATKTPYIIEQEPATRPGLPGQLSTDPAAAPGASQPLKRKATEPAAAAPKRAEAWAADPSCGGSGAASEEGTPSDSECTPYDRRRADSVIKARRQALEEKKRRTAAGAKDASAMPPPAAGGQRGRAVAGQQQPVQRGPRATGGNVQTQSQQPRANSKPGAAAPRPGRLASMSVSIDASEAETHRGPEPSQSDYLYSQQTDPYHARPLKKAAGGRAARMAGNGGGANSGGGASMVSGPPPPPRRRAMQHGAKRELASEGDALAPEAAVAAAKGFARNRSAAAPPKVGAAKPAAPKPAASNAAKNIFGSQLM
ncbi:hypothetical protein Rsub_08543 [Raphidocelis subcapitata]|uniref:Uncharacterized protein n=1 Tax=Raphidocelis subcapitata TaxID=307507 RepID=A0A2V0P9D4_9CHLO|nr:hypothetical protein Rsub_08543 [Raphidocelis subcapitata]|eukprot:GBF95562.1 hypothetical protein Rsub_08543 [Raphidocelis subcapitata]